MFVSGLSAGLNPNSDLHSTDMTATKVVFVCLHGSAKSLIAAEHFRRLATESGHRVAVSSLGVEPDDTIPPPVIRGLADDGFDVSMRVPERLTSDALSGANVVVSFGCAIEPSPASTTIVRWDDIPMVSDGYGHARDAIVAKLRDLLPPVVS
jgi:protein-tyrosine-phosphatase